MSTPKNAYWCSFCDREVPRHVKNIDVTMASSESTILGCMSFAFICFVLGFFTCGITWLGVPYFLLMSSIFSFQNLNYRSKNSKTTICPICTAPTARQAKQQPPLLSDKSAPPNKNGSSKQTSSPAARRTNTLPNWFMPLILAIVLTAAALYASTFAVCFGIPIAAIMSDDHEQQRQRKLSGIPVEQTPKRVETFRIPAGQEVPWTGGFQKTETVGFISVHDAEKGLDLKDAAGLGGVKLAILIWCEDNTTKAMLEVRGMAELTGGATTTLHYDDGSTFGVRLGKVTFIDKLPPRFIYKVGNAVSFSRSLIGKRSVSGDWRQKGFTGPLHLNFGEGNQFEIELGDLDEPIAEVRRACHW